MRGSLLLLMAACQSSRSAPEPKVEPRNGTIEVHDLAQGVTAKLVPGRPCRASVDGIDLQIGGDPMVAQVGTMRWTGDDRGNGITLLKDGDAVARIVEDNGLALIDPQGVAMVRVIADGDDVKVIDRQNAVVRHLAKTDKGIEVQPGPTVTGTEDRLLAAVLTAVEAPPEVRAMAACHRLFALEKK